MKVRFWSRLLIAFCGLITLVFGAALFAYGAGFFPFHWDLSALNIDFALWQRVVIVGVALILLVIGLYGLCVLFRRSRDKGFIIQHTEFGDMSISMRALENMVKKCVESHSELSPGTTRITRTRDGVAVAIKVTLNTNANIPLTVNALQKQIKQYITSSSGVDVREVRVMVETNASKLDEPPKVELEETPEESAPANGSTKDECIFHHTEEPSRYAEPATEDAHPQAPVDDATSAEQTGDEPEEPVAKPDEAAGETGEDEEVKEILDSEAEAEA